MPICVGIDAGGTLSKVGVYASGDDASREVLRWLRPRIGASDIEPQMPLALGDGTLHSPPTFSSTMSGMEAGSVAFSIIQSGFPGLAQCVSAIAAAAHRAGTRALGQVHVAATGGLCHKYVRLFERLRRALDAAGGRLRVVGEFDALVGGVNTLLQGPFPAFYRLTDFRFHGDVGPDRVSVRKQSVAPPSRSGLLIINIGTGTSIIDLDPPHADRHEEELETGGAGHAPGLPQNYNRVGGTSLGGGTFLGLCKALTGASSFKEALALAAKGDSKNVDMLVGDIYGEDQSPGLGALRRSTLASSFAKLGRDGSTPHSPPRREDLALAALVMVTMNVANIANLHARLHNRDTLLFTGSFLAKDNNMARRTFAYATHFWSEGKRSALFIESAPYVGALGALSLVVPRTGQQLERTARIARGRGSRKRARL
eukprot:TRINITY_DN3032_c1_g1_i1.p2 TRINITY_DN3032_c1_g1~~TRINITY_DN3032_c1_g1_i1.p2  ORF type:complete len:427 (+),score=94.89 TRINITY_DN3032_c1_g1_i1:48-1328(+)